jgi:ABC-type amino acid transport substrate-binding protein
MLRRIVFLAAFLMMLSQPARADDETVYNRIIASGTIRCGYWTWPPFLVKDPNTGALTGPTYDYMEAVGHELGLKIEWTEEVGAGEFIAGLSTNRYDVMCMSLWPDAARLKNVTVSDPIFYSVVYAVTRKGDHRFDGNLDKINDAGVTVVGIEGDITESGGRVQYSKAKMLALPQSTDISQVLHSIVTKKGDVAFVDAGLIKDFNKTNKDALEIVAQTLPVKIFPEVLGVKNGELHLKAMLDAAINVLSNNRYAGKILQAYTMSSYPPLVDYDLAFKTQIAKP